jgi:hypothetical protein
MVVVLVVLYAPLAQVSFLLPVLIVQPPLVPATSLALAHLTENTPEKGQTDMTILLPVPLALCHLVLSPVLVPLWALHLLVFLLASIVLLPRVLGLKKQLSERMDQLLYPNDLTATLYLLSGASSLKAIWKACSVFQVVARPFFSSLPSSLMYLLYYL